MGGIGSLNRRRSGGRCAIGMAVLFRNEYAIERMGGEERVGGGEWLSRLFAWIAPADEGSPVSLVNFERVMRATRTLARQAGTKPASGVFYLKHGQDSCAGRHGGEQDRGRGGGGAAGFGGEGAARKLAGRGG